MKYSPLILAAGAVGLVFANPHVHRTNDNSVAKKGVSSEEFRAGSGTGGDACPCNTSWDGTQCAALHCGDSNGDPVCNNGNGCTVDHSAITEGGLDPHVLVRHEKVCRFNNDASCHRCPTTSCQYKFGNYYGTGYPCVNIEGVIPGTSSTHAVDESTGQGVQVVVSSDYGADQIMKFCDSDNYAVSHYQATECHGERFATIVQPKTCTHCQTLRCISPKFMLRYIDFNMAQSWFDLTYIGYNAQTNSDVPMDYFDCQDHNGASVDGVTTLQDCYAKSSSNSIVYIGPDSDVNANYHSVKLVNLQFDGIYTQ